MTLPARKTLAELRTELQARLGFSSLGTQQQTILNSFLQGAQEQLHEMFDWPYLKVTNDLSFTSGTRFLPWPDNQEPRRIHVVQVDTSTGTSNPSIWVKLRKGIDYIHDSVSPGGWPLRFDDGFDTSDNIYKMEIWPIPTQTWTVRVEGISRLNSFAADTDQASLNERHIFLFALASAKAHYRQPDAAVIGRQVVDFTRKVKAAEHENRRYIMGEHDPKVPPMPRMI